MGAWIETLKILYDKLTHKSHPTWVRGLKLVASSIIMEWMVSHPTWVRGLKLRFWVVIQNPKQVAPYVGAWIETCLRQRAGLSSSVAPYVGAWIETIKVGMARRLLMSHPTWVRELKLPFLINTI